jgi:magnesium chelatase family protein
MQACEGESSAVVQQRCQQAHDRAIQTRGVSNHRLSAAQLQDLTIDTAAERVLQQYAARQAWSARAVHRVLRVAQTIADLAQSQEIEVTHVMQAMHFRMALKQ